MMKRHVRIAVYGIIMNVVLFTIKLLGGMVSGSLALLSDSFNSMTDILASLAIFLAVRIGTKKADADHPFGHRRAEPIAGLIVAIFAAILGFQIISNAFRGLFEARTLDIDLYIFVIVIASIGIKAYAYVLFRKEGRRTKSPALIASSMEYRNDILVTSLVLLGIFSAYVGYTIIDTLVAFLVGCFIVYSGFQIGMTNLDFLMGKMPHPEIIEGLKKKALTIDGVKKLHDVRAHYLGHFIQIEVHIEVDRKLSTHKSHEIAEKVQLRLQDEEIVDYAFVHVDPV
jgi:cation diffusion facilitator family transporter